MRARPGRRLAALGIVAAGAMLGTATTLSYGLATGWERAAQRADLPDVIVRFDPDDRERDRGAGAAPAQPRGALLPARAQRPSDLRGGRAIPSASTHIVRDGRRGYAIVEGRDARAVPPRWWWSAASRASGTCGRATR